VTDADGDSASTAAIDVGSAVTFLDDGPAIASAVVGSSVTLDEGQTDAGQPPMSTAAAITLPFGYTAGNDLDVSGTGYISKATSGSALVTVTPSFGADGPAAVGSVSYALSAVAGASGVTLTDGTKVNLVQISSTLVLGVVAGQPNTVAFAISMDAGSGKVTVEQYLSLHNPTPGTSYDETTSLTNGALSVIATVTDGDDDTNTSNAVSVGSQIVFHDDGPTMGTFTTGVIPNEVGSVSGFFSLASGADGIDHFDITGPSITGISYVTTYGSDGATTLHGQNGGSDVFSLTVAPDGTYHFNLSAPQLATTETLSFSQLGAGGPGFRELGDDSSTAINEAGRVEFQSNGTNGVNASNQGFGVDDQWTSKGEWFEMEFHNPGQYGVNDAAGSNPDLLSSVTINVQQVNHGPVKVHWTATNPTDGTHESGDIYLYGSGSVTIDPTIPFSVLKIENISGGDAVSTDDKATFRMATDITIAHTILPPGQDYDFNIIAVDGDGDTTSPQTLHIDQVAAGNGGAYTLTGTAGDDVIAGSGHQDTITGGGGFDIVDYHDATSAITVNLNTGLGAGGTANGDTYSGIEGIIGGSGNDTLIGDALANLLDGGSGEDTMTGGGGADTFVVSSDAVGGAINDVIADFNIGQGDQIDLSELLKGIAAGTDLETSGYVKIEVSGANSVVSVDVNGGGDGYQVVAELQAFNYSSSSSEAVKVLFEDSSGVKHPDTV
ncbi:DUF5801 repeats-in-toxin domain-containing protein, partial [Ollibium composti]